MRKAKDVSFGLGRADMQVSGLDLWDGREWPAFNQSAHLRVMPVQGSI